MKRVYKRSLENESSSKKNQEEKSIKVTLLLRNSNNISVTIVFTKSDDRNQDEADSLRSQRRTTATMVAIVSKEAYQSHPVALIAIDSIQPVSIDQG
jgi:putative ribosome biogenesis GTPase RsgA